MDKLTSVINNDYITMCKLMCSSHEELIANLANNDIRNGLVNDVWLFFGSSKAGKSTLLARIKTSLDNIEFMEAVNKSKKSDEPIFLDGIAFAGGSRAVTTVPNLHIKNDQLYMDLAGFVDTDPKREAVISLLNNCLFSKLNSCKIIIVMDVGFLTGGISLVMQTYVKELERLLTPANFELGLASCGFILTKADVFGYNIIALNKEDDDEDFNRLNSKEISEKLKKSVKKIIGDFSIEMASIDIKLTKLASAISLRNCVVNYKDLGSDSVTFAIQNMMKKVRPLESKKMHFDTVSASSVLSRDSLQIVKVYKELVQNKSNKILEIKKNVEDHYVREKSYLEKMKLSLEKSLQTISDSKKLVIEKEVMINSISDQNSALSKRITELGEEKSHTELSLKAFEEKIKNFKMLWMVSSKSVKKNPRKDEQRVIGEFVRPLGCRERIHIVIMSEENYNRHHVTIENCESYKTFTDLQLPTLYFDGSKTAENKAFNVIQSSSNDKFLSISTSGSISHVVLLLCDINIIDTPLKMLTNNYFVEQRDAVVKAIFTSEKQIEDNNKKIEQFRKDVVNSTSIKSKEDETLVSIQNNIRICKSKFGDRSKEIIDTFSELTSSLRKDQNDEVLKMTESLGKILVSSNVEVNAYREIPDIRRSIESSLSSESIINSTILKYNVEIVSM
jgi:hypothetical protein